MRESQGQCPASTPGGSSTGGSHGCKEPKGSHHGDNWGGSPGLLRDAQHAPSPWPCRWHQRGWPGIAPYLKLQWAAVTTQYWLIKEPPQKWDPVRVWGGKREEELGLGGLNTPKLGTGLVPNHGTQLAVPVLRAVPREQEGAVPAGTPARAMSRAQRSAH